MKTQENKKTFAEIYKINVNDKSEKKGNFAYLSWAYAWSEIKHIDSEATFKVVENINGMPFHYDSSFPKIGAFVKVEMTFQGVSLTQTHPILNHSNKSVAVEDLNSFMINTSIQRALAKVAGLHGLGLYIYAGEDLPKDGGSTLGERVDEVIANQRKLELESKGITGDVAVRAMVAIENKDDAKEEGFRWDKDNKIWVKRMTQEEFVHSKFNFEIVLV